jgi:hypothetical protein
MEGAERRDQRVTAGERLTPLGGVARAAGAEPGDHGTPRHRRLVGPRDCPEPDEAQGEKRCRQPSGDRQLFLRKTP